MLGSRMGLVENVFGDLTFDSITAGNFEIFQLDHRTSDRSTLPSAISLLLVFSPLFFLTYYLHANSPIQNISVQRRTPVSINVHASQVHSSILSHALRKVLARIPTGGPGQLFTKNSPAISVVARPIREREGGFSIKPSVTSAQCLCVDTEHKVP